MDPLPIVIIGTLAMITGLTLWIIKRARQPLHDPGMAEDDEPYLTAQVRRALHPEAYGEDSRMIDGAREIVRNSTKQGD